MRKKIKKETQCENYDAVLLACKIALNNAKRYGLEAELFATALILAAEHQEAKNNAAWALVAASYEWDVE